MISGFRLERRWRSSNSQQMVPKDLRAAGHYPLYHQRPGVVVVGAPKWAISRPESRGCGLGRDSNNFHKTRG
ncbi:hypothetical protein PoB_000874900 [Plakobranchus ocellatus]|uniref:Uncharacterized protein n=1 Tax=Plakobranchus ocellatus TaxID=259542 RepID=A0AAV3YGV7_9GAST|nr:hypothetical protein PoB_000874900 [Plakobranchus ocellatus]